MPYQNWIRVVEHLWAPIKENPALKVYAILDGARDERIYRAITEACDERDYRCLFQGHQAIFLGKLPQVLAEAAPYVVHLNLKTNFAKWMISRGWGDCWGIFLHTEAPVDKLTIHLRRFIMVKQEGGKPFYFRYYDPRVMRPYLPTCNAEELEMIFGPVQRYLMEGETDDTVLGFRCTKGGLERRTVDLTPPIGR